VSDVSYEALLNAKLLAIMSIGVVAVAAAVEAALLIGRTIEIDRAKELAESYRLAVTGNELLDALAIVIGVASLGSLAAWLAWHYRAVSLLRTRVEATRDAPSWSILWWFVPVADLWMPAVTNAELWRGAQVPAGRGGRSWLVWIWWVLLVGGWLTHTAGRAVRQVGLGVWGLQFSPSFFPPEDVVAGVTYGGQIASAGAIALVAAAPFALLVLLRITRQLAETGRTIAPVRPDV
jgi:uncharacterized protein DUF4328